MNSVFKKVISIASCAALCLTSTLAYAATTSTTGYYNTYSTISDINVTSPKITQGMSVGKTYVYTARIKADETKCSITKTKIKTGEVTVMKNSANNSTTFTSLGHANDMCQSTLNGVNTLFVATLQANSNSVVRFAIDGNKLTKVGKYSTTLNGTKVGAGAIDVLKKTSTQITFLFKKGKQFYTGTLDYAKTSGTIELKEAFKIDVKNLTINGKAFDASSFTHQGFCLEGNNVFVPLWNGASKTNQSIIVVYDISNPTGTLKANKDLSFKVTSSSYDKTFEIEGCGICSADNKLYFVANRKKSTTTADYDAVMCFKDFVY